MLYTIERDFLGYSDGDLNSAAFRALLCMSFFQDMDWVRSFYDPASEQGRCFYEATSSSDIREHAETMAIPVGAIRPVIEVRPTAAGRVELGEPVDKADRREAGDTTAWIARLALTELADADLLSRFSAIPARPGGPWERAYVDRDIDEVFAVFRAPDRHVVETGVGPLGMRLLDLREMREVLPQDITGPGGAEVAPIARSSMAGVSG